MSSFITPHCICAFIVCYTLDGPRYLLLRRCGAYLTNTWQMVTGKIDPPETAPQAALREIQEETGLTPYALYNADAVETFYMLSIDKITFAPVFIAFVRDMNVILSPSEHDLYEWLPFEQAKERLAWAEQRRIIAQIHEYSVLQKPHKLLEVNLNSQTIFSS